MYLEFKDSFRYNHDPFAGCEWLRDTLAINELNEWIDKHPDYKVKIISYRAVYSDYFKSSQTHIFAEAVHIEEPSKEDIPSKPEKPRALKLGWSI